MYRAKFSADRWMGVPNLWVECDGIRLEKNVGFPFTRAICQALKDAGRVDGAIEFVRNKDSEPYYTFSSVHALAEGRAVQDRPVSQPVPRAALSDIMYLALCQIAADPANWLLLHGHTRRTLLERGFIDVQDDLPLITETARQAVVAFEAKGAYPDIADANEDQIHWAGGVIGLHPKRISRRTLLFIERMIVRHTVGDLEARARSVGVVPPVAIGSDEMQRRRLMAAITNAGKLALAL